MYTNDSTPETELFPEIPNYSKRNIILLIAALVILAGFFLPWIGQGRSGGMGYDFDDDYRMPTINGLYLLNVTSQLPEIGWLLMLFVVLIPVGSIIVAYNSYQHSYSEKVMMFGVAAAVFIPLTVLAISLVSPGAQLLFGGLGGVKLGIGLILMGAGSLYCLIYAIGRISRNMQGILSGPIFKFGALGGIITGVLMYVILQAMRSGGAGGFYLYLLIVGGGVVLSVYTYRSNTDHSNYHSGQVTGFVFSGVFTVTLIIIASIESSSVIGRATEGLIFFLVYQLLLGFVLSSLVGSTETPTYELELDETTAVDPPSLTDSEQRMN